MKPVPVWKSQPVMAASAICGAWILMRLAVAGQEGETAAVSALPPAITLSQKRQFPADRKPEAKTAGPQSAIVSGHSAPPMIRHPSTHHAPRRRWQAVATENHPLAPPSTAPGTVPMASTLPSIHTQYASPLEHTHFTPNSPRNHHNSLTISAWMLARSGGLASAVPAQGSLGGAQVGMRITVPLSGSGIGIVTGVSAPLATKTGREGRLGLSVKPLRAWPVEILVERRIGLDRNTPSRTVIMAAGGVSDALIGRGWKASGYAQFGVAGLRQGTAFADGEISVTRPAFRLGTGRFTAGLGVWGAAQKGLHRVDIGPVIETRVRINERPVRLSLQWRERMEGKARPKSGPALVIGSDF
jgi:hypothetical protein